MCIFSQPVVSVSDTNIFARLLPDGWQYLVYQMRFETREKNAMVLPLPVQLPATDDETLEFISLQQHESFFEDLNKGFPLALPNRSFLSQGIDSKVTEMKPTLEVHDVGDFIASFVPSIGDFDRLDEQFRVPQESWDKIPRYSDFGFAVFQLKSLQGQPHPMAFKFRSRLNQPENGSLFFPTVHIHDGEVHKREKFDHTLFLQDPAFDNACGGYKQRGYPVTDPATGYVRSKWPAKEFCDIDASCGIVDPDALVHRLEMRGRLDNVDVLASLHPSDFKKQSGLLPWLGLPITVGVAGFFGLKWFFDRRDRVAEESAEESSR